MNTHKRYRILATLACLTLMLALTIANVSASPALQAATDFAAIDAYVTEQMNNLGIPGMALGIVQGDQVAHLQGFGVADSSGRTVTPQTPFYIGSVTKSFTALAVMQLVEAGKIELDAPVQHYLPWFELADKAASATITVRNLLNQTTGFTRMDGELAWTRQGLEQMTSGLKSLRPAAPVGTTYLYSNLNYILAGLIVEQASGQAYGDYVSQHIFAPLAMQHSHVTRAAALADGLSDGHHYMFGRAFVAKAEGIFSLAAGGLIVSAEDMAHFALANLNEGRYGDTAILSAQGMAELHAAPLLVNEGDGHYAMGWDVGRLDGMPVIGHGGALSNFRSEIRLLPEQGWGVILLANAHGFEQFAQLPEITDRVVGLLNGKAPAPISVPWQLPFLYWSIVLVPFVQMLGIAFSGRYWRGKGIGYVLLIVVLYGAVAYLWLTWVPNVTGIAIWSGLREVYPDLFYPLVTGVALGIGWSVIFTVLNLMTRRAK